MGTQAAVEPWAQALGRVPSGLFVLTVRGPAGETGMLASWVQQCSFDPPQLTAAVRKDRFVLGWLSDGARFGVNILPEGAKALVAHFGKGFEAGEPAFTGLKVERHPGTAPVLLDAHAWLDCRVAGRFDAGDHVLILGRVVGGRVLHEGKPTTHIRKNGLHY
jgi:flavin reductase (DIM6/NTAB) family NADH-FMN oxidoreductase RutF